MSLNVEMMSMLPCDVTQCYDMLQGYHAMSPNAEMMPGLPPMSSFRGGSLPPSSAPYNNTSPAVNSSEIVGATNHANTSVAAPSGGSPETGDALGKALASVSLYTRLILGMYCVCSGNVA